MRRLRTDIAVVGNGCFAALLALKFHSQGHGVVLVNPGLEFSFEDIRPMSGLGVWNAVVRKNEIREPARIFDELVERVRESYPASTENLGLKKVEHWSVLSSTPVHRDATTESEKDFFRLEKRAFPANQFRLLNSEHISNRARFSGLALSRVAEIEGGLFRHYGVWWNAHNIAKTLWSVLQGKSHGQDDNFRFVTGKIQGLVGRKAVVSLKDDAELSIEPDAGLFVCLTGEVLPTLKYIVSSIEEPWIQGIRRRRCEAHYACFRKPAADVDPYWLALGATEYYCTAQHLYAHWVSPKGPDGFERVIDEALRFSDYRKRRLELIHNTRSFQLKWDWPLAQWRTSQHQVYWATGFENDLWGMTELLWNLPST